MNINSYLNVERRAVTHGQHIHGGDTLAPERDCLQVDFPENKLKKLSSNFFLHSGYFYTNFRH